MVTIIILFGVFAFKSTLDYLEIAFHKTPLMKRRFIRWVLFRALLLASLSLFFTHTLITSLNHIFIMLWALYLAFLLLSVIEHRRFGKHMFASSGVFIKEGLSLIMVALALMWFFMRSNLSNIFMMLLVSLVIILIIYILLFSVVIKHFVKLIPYRLRENTALFESHPSIFKQLYMAKVKKVRLPMNALFTQGLKNSKVVFSDALLSRLKTPEIKGILAHELGHGAHKHIVIRFFVLAFVLMVYFLLGHLIIDLGYFTINDSFLSTLIVLMAWLYFFEQIIMTLIYQLTQYQEYQSDYYAYKLGYGKELSEALHTIYRYQREPRMHPLNKRFTLSHPDTELRIKRLNEYA